MSFFPRLDSELLFTIERARSGDEAAFEVLVGRYQSAVFRLLYRRLRQYEDAEDETQQVFMEMYRKLPRLRDPAALNAWICSLVRCRVATRLRRHRVETAELTESPVALPMAPCGEREELKIELLNFIEHLNEPLRSTTRLFYLEGLSTQQISNLTGAPLGTIKRRLHSARARLEGNLSPRRKDAKNGMKESF